MRIVSANVYVGNRRPVAAVAALAALRADVVGVQEATRRIRLNTLKGEVWQGIAPGCAEVPIVTKHPVDGSLAYQLTGGIRGSKWAKPRGLTLIRLPQLGTVRDVTVINIHLNACVQTRKGRVRTWWPGTKLYAEQTRKLEHQIIAERLAGRRVILTGDINYRRPKSGPVWSESALAVCERQGLVVAHHGVDVIAWDPAAWLGALGLLTARPVDVPGSDHKALCVDLAAVTAPPEVRITAPVSAPVTLSVEP